MFASSIASAPRGTLTVAPTQNTAPVFEFSCLYSPDLRKKKKIWHDGSLRFHTFNRRVMVYDDGKNYIGDTHWRADEEFAEGAELRLDKGLLVEVQEQVGATETDLAPVILEKHRPQQPPNQAPSNVVPSTPVPQMAARPTAQGRPKSLADVLGASQGRIGRAQRQIRSPFEMKQVNAPVNQAPVPQRAVFERPTKKPRLEKENVVYNTKPLRQVTAAAQPARKLLQRLPEAPPVDTSSVIDLAESPVRRHEAPQLSEGVGRNARTREAPLAEPIRRAKESAKRKNTGQAAPIPAETRSSKQTRLVAPRQAPNKQPDPMPPAKRAKDSNPRPRNLLLAAQGPPPRKLIYKELLLRSRGQSKAPSRPADTTRKRPALSTSHISNDEESTSPARLRPGTRTPAPKRSTIADYPPTPPPPPSPLFFSQDPDLPPLDTQASLIESPEPLPEPSPEIDPGASNPPTIPCNPSKSTQSRATILPPNPPPPLLPPPPKPQAAPARPFKSPLRATDHRLLHSDPAPPLSPHTTPSKLQRSISDTTHLAAKPKATNKTKSNNGFSGGKVQPAIQAVFEPWSVVEAGVLFEWWPEGRERPGWWAVEGAEEG